MPRIAADTNIIVRILARDDAAQLESARVQLFETGLIVSTTVLLEVEWVLRGSLRLGRREVNQALSALCGIPQVEFAEPDRILTAIEWHATGMDFADALHLAGVADCDEFVTFDRDLAKKAETADAIAVRLL